MKLDERCISLFYQKDEAAVNQVYACTNRLLRHVAFGVLSDMDLAQDAAMEAYTNALYSSTPLRSPTSFIAYLCSASKNAALSIARKRSHEERLEEEIPTSPVKDSGVLGKLNQELGSPDYDILILHVVEGYSFEEIAVFLDLGTASAARGKYARAKAKAKDILGKEVL